MVDKEKLRKFDELEKNIRKGLYGYISEKLMETYPQYFSKDIGVLQVAYKDKDLVVCILVDDENVLCRNIRVGNKDVWNHIVNHLYFDRPKTVVLESDNNSFFEEIVFPEEVYRHIGEINDNEGYKKLYKEIFDREVK